MHVYDFDPPIAASLSRPDSSGIIPRRWAIRLSLQKIRTTVISSGITTQRANNGASIASLRIFAWEVSYGIARKQWFCTPITANLFRCHVMDAHDAFLAVDHQYKYFHTWLVCLYSPSIIKVKPAWSGQILQQRHCDRYQMSYD